METVAGAPIREALSRVELLLLRLNQGIVIALMATMSLLVFANVVSRYAFNHSMVWVEELTQYQMIWIAWLGAGLALREGRHVAVDVVQDLLPGPLLRLLRWVIVAVMLAFLATLVWYGTRIVAFSWNQETPMLGLPAGIPYLGIPIGAALFALHLLMFARAFVDRNFEYVDDPGAGE
ncbi:MAG: TRAP transporter small permease [Burkholderiaceae bacterium]|nr:TRAP transporter small permease [Burkholderiaceae bacterium]